MRVRIALAAGLVHLAVTALALEKQESPTVDIGYATVVGSSDSGIDSFRGIPYAQPPVGKLRLKPPQHITANLGTVMATGIEGSCPQLLVRDAGSYFNNVVGDLFNDPYFQTVTGASEDCLTVNVQRPSSANADSKLPVLFWIFGGGFAFGSTQIYDASDLISTSMAQGKDIIYVAVNYRLSGFGFLPGAEILRDGSANLGLLDQRLSLEWVADNIAQFGGDPEKVTIWGQSAGAISAFDQMALYKGDNTYKGKPLFRAAILDSGSIAPTDPVDCPKGQAVYNQVVSASGCSGSPDTLECLRDVKYTTYLNAVNSLPTPFSYTSVALSYLPRPDGVILADSSDVLVSNGQYARVPLIVGDQEDEGTIFSLFQSNITTTDLLVSYLSEIFFHDIPVDQLQELVSLYPDDPSAGSPYNTSHHNEIYPQYKRIAAILGDLTFTMSRRLFLTVATQKYPEVPSWSYLSSYGCPVPILGTFHGSDLLRTYGVVPGLPTSSVQAYYLSFVNTLDPNNGTTGEISWLQWITGQQLLNFRKLVNVLVTDNFRSEIFSFLYAHVSALHI